MSKTCIVKLNAQSGKWEALFSGKVLVRGYSRDYVVGIISQGVSKKAQALDVTKCDVVEDTTVNEAGETVATPTVESEFPINERFMIMTDYVDMVAQRELASALVTGEGGLGKTHTVMKTLKSTGLKDLATMEIGARFEGAAGYTVVKGYSTPKGLFRTLYENRKQIIVFDDCDAVLRDPTAVNLLKAALDSYDTRMITWNAEGWGDDDIPKSFEFSGGVIFISNLPKSKIPQAIRSRAMCADVSMTRDECVQRMRVIVDSEEFMPEFEMSHKLEALEFVAEHANNPMITELNLRSLINVTKARASKPDHWKRLGLYSMANS